MKTEKKRRLAAIMFADMVGYTAMMQRNEQEGLTKVHRFSEVVEAQVKTFHGEILEFKGDGCLVVFESAVEAMRAAKAIQYELKQEPTVPLRIGIHIGDIVFTRGNIYGDGVNLASRVESMGVPGSILVTEQVIPSIKSHPEFEMASLGKFQFKNVEKPMEVFALANEGFAVPSPEEMKGKGEKVKAKKPVSLLVGIGVILGLAIWLGIYLNLDSNMDQSGGISIAVLPFENYINDPEFEYFPASMAQELCDRLSSMEDLTVLARRACLRFKNTDLKPTQIARELKANYLIEGSVRKSGKEIKLSSQLIDGTTGIQIASYPFTGKMEDVFDFQDQAALQIANQLQIKLKPKEVSAIKNRYTDNTQAYVAYMKGWRLLESLHSDISPTKEKMDGAKQYFEEAIREDSLFALPYAGLSLVESAYIFIGVKTDYDPQEKSLSYANKALSLNNNLPEGFFALGDLAQMTGKNEKSIEYFNKSLDIKFENPIAWCHLAASCHRIGRYDSAVYAANIAIQQQPTYSWSHYVLANALRAQKKYKEAIEAYQYLIQLEPTWINAYFACGNTYLLMQEYEHALEMFQKIEKVASNSNRLRIYKAYSYAGLGQNDSAMFLLEDAFKHEEKRFMMLEFSPFLRSLKKDQRFGELLVKYRKENGNIEENVGIRGPALETGWTKSIYLKPTNRKKGIWEADITLGDGEVLFMVNDDWSFMWRGESFPSGTAKSYGPNIIVEAGTYHIVLNLEKLEYEFLKVDI